jgi:hypothetical protein
MSKTVNLLRTEEDSDCTLNKTPGPAEPCTFGQLPTNPVLQGTEPYLLGNPSTNERDFLVGPTMIEQYRHLLGHAANGICGNLSEQDHFRHRPSSGPTVTRG